jgi:predicted ATPase
MLLREPRRVLHGRVAEALESHFPEIAESQPELLARHCTEAGLIGRASDLWGKAGHRSLARSALVEATTQLSHALNLIATLPGTPDLRREQINLQVAHVITLMHTKGYGATETKASFNQASLYIERGEALREPLEDPLLLLSVLYGFWVAGMMTFNGDVMQDVAAQFSALAEKQETTVPLMMRDRVMGVTLMCAGDIAAGRAHLDRAIARFDPVEHRRLAHFGGLDIGVGILHYRSMALWCLGYPEAACADAARELKDAREIGQAITLMSALGHASLPHLWSGNYATVKTITEELLELAHERGTPQWKALGMIYQGWVTAMTGEPSDAIGTIASGITLRQSTGATLWLPLYLPFLSRVYAKLGNFDEAWRSIGEAIAAVETTKEKWCEAEVHRAAGEITLLSPEPDAAKAEAYFQRALAAARKQQAKSWELRAAMSLARLWRDQGKRQQAHDLLAPVYGWFTEGFDTLDLKDAKALLEQLA